MTQNQTDRLGLPLLATGQAQKEITHNEALLLVDLLCQSVAESADLATPPGSPTPGQCWIIASPATGDWAGKVGSVAGWTENGWRFATPNAGWCLWVADRNLIMRFDGGDWIDEPVRQDGYFVDNQRVLAGRQPAISGPREERRSTWKRVARSPQSWLRCAAMG